MLLAKGADVNIKNKKGGTALMAACGERSRPEIVAALLAHGADAYSKNAALKIATERNHREAKELLIKAGAK